MTSHTAAAAQGPRPGRHPPRRTRSRRSPAWAWSASAGGQRPAVRIQANPHRAGAHWAVASTTCAPPSAAPTSTSAKGSFDGPAARLHHRRQRPAAAPPTNTSQIDHRLPERRAARASPTSPTSSTAPRTRGWRPGPTASPAIVLNIQRQPGANVIEVVDRIKALLPQLQAALPAVGGRAGADRPHHHHPRLGRRRAVRAAAGRSRWW